MPQDQDTAPLNVGSSGRASEMRAPSAFPILMMHAREPTSHGVVGL
jgi:hypothetical protein